MRTDNRYEVEFADDTITTVEALNKPQAIERAIAARDPSACDAVRAVRRMTRRGR